MKMKLFFLEKSPGVIAVVDAVGELRFTGDKHALIEKLNVLLQLLGVDDRFSPSKTEIDIDGSTSSILFAMVDALMSVGVLPDAPSALDLMAKLAKLEHPIQLFRLRIYLPRDLRDAFKEALRNPQPS